MVQRTGKATGGGQDEVGEGGREMVYTLVETKIEFQEGKRGGELVYILVEICGEGEVGESGREVVYGRVEVRTEGQVEEARREVVGFNDLAPRREVGERGGEIGEAKGGPITPFKRKAGEGGRKRGYGFFVSHFCMCKNEFGEGWRQRGVPRSGSSQLQRGERGRKVLYFSTVLVIQDEFGERGRKTVEFSGEARGREEDEVEEGAREVDEGIIEGSSKR